MRLFGQCIDDYGDRVLTVNGEEVKSSLDPNGALYCRNVCKAQGYRYAGTETNDECWCGNSFRRFDLRPGECNDDCTGNSNEKCGDGWRMNVYYAGKYA